MATLAPRVVVVHRRTELEALLDRHGTRGAAEFFLRQRGRDLAGVEAAHEAQAEALREVAGAVPGDWRRGVVERADLPRFLFAADDVVVVVGQDGLVANAAKYLDGQPVVGIDPWPGAGAGGLVHPAPAHLRHVLLQASSGAAAVQRRTMVQASTDDGQRLLALNEVFVGHQSHQTARYRLAVDDLTERQASSGLVVSTGTGATGWCASLAAERHSGLALPTPEDGRLAWFVREAWPSPTTGTALTEGLLTAGTLGLEVLSDRLVVFGDGMENDNLELSWGQRIEVGLAAQTLALVSDSGERGADG
ncbi:hypothetical protein [Pedococcus sp. P5_B7]